MSKRSLNQWVDYIQTLHFREIDLTLDRVREVLSRFEQAPDNFKIITLAGTNGKGSTAAMLSEVLRSANYSVGKYTSPHLVRFNERYQINGQDIDDRRLLESFERIEAARQDISLTFFEYGTLIAIDLFIAAEVDVAVMEVGLGGRLDAVNVLDADVAVVTSISIDHSAWLGETVEQISREKIGIARTGRPCVIGMAEPADSLLAFCSENNVNLVRYARDFEYQYQAGHNTWVWQYEDQQINKLPLPFAQSGVQLNNAAVALTALHLLPGIKLDADQIRHGLAQARVAARCQLVATEPALVLDVAHNVDSVARLREFVADLQIKGRVIALCGMLADKEIADSLQLLVPLVDKWNFATIYHERGSLASELGEHLAAAKRQAGSSQNEIADQQDKVTFYDHVTTAYEAIYLQLSNDDCLVVFGSFFIVGDIISLLADSSSI